MTALITPSPFQPLPGPPFELEPGSTPEPLHGSELPQSIGYVAVESVETPATAKQDLKILYTGEGINASGGEHFSNAIFGRDTAYTDLFLLHSLQNRRDNGKEPHDQDVQIIENTVKSLVKHQGTRNRLSESLLGQPNAEEPGKIHHEARRHTVEGNTPSDTIIDQLEGWAHPEDKPNLYVYYSVDATPLFLKLVSEYAKTTGDQNQPKIADQKVETIRGEQITIGESVLRAVDWLEGRLGPDQSTTGFLEYYRLPGQEQGIRNQVWKDSLTSYIHENGELVNTNAPVASIEVQALAYDALLDTAELFEADNQAAQRLNIGEEKIRQWKDTAEQLRRDLLEKFWLPDEQHFAQALDHDPKAWDVRKVKTASSNQFHLLNSRIFDGLPEAEREKYITPLVEQIFSDEFLTDAGVRCRARSLHNLVDFADYQGSWAVWPWEVGFIANGLRKQGFTDLADELGKRVLNTLNTLGGNDEFCLVDPVSNKVFYRFAKKSEVTDETPGRLIVATNLRDKRQAWTAAASLDIKRTLGSVEAQQKEWAKRLEDEILAHIPRAELLTDREEMEAMRQRSELAIIDTEAGKAADQRYYALAEHQFHEAA